jgi:hypothetical protein
MPVIFLLLINLVFPCEELIKEQIEFLNQPRHPVKVNLSLTIYEDVFRPSYFGEVSIYQDGLKSERVWEESCTQTDNFARFELTPQTLTLFKGEEIHTFKIHCDKNFIIGEGKNEKMVGTFQYEYNIR